MFLCERGRDSSVASHVSHRVTFSWKLLWPTGFKQAITLRKSLSSCQPYGLCDVTKAVNIASMLLPHTPTQALAPFANLNVSGPWRLLNVSEVKQSVSYTKGV